MLVLAAKVDPKLSGYEILKKAIINNNCFKKSLCNNPAYNFSQALYQSCTKSRKVYYYRTKPCVRYPLGKRPGEYFSNQIVPLATIFAWVLIPLRKCMSFAVFLSYTACQLAYIFFVKIQVTIGFTFSPYFVCLNVFN